MSGIWHNPTYYSFRINWLKGLFNFRHVPDIDTYLDMIQNPSTWIGPVELQMAAIVLDRPIINITPKDGKSIQNGYISEVYNRGGKNMPIAVKFMINHYQVRYKILSQCFC